MSTAGGAGAPAAPSSTSVYTQAFGGGSHRSRHGPGNAMSGLIMGRHPSTAELTGRTSFEQPVRLRTEENSYLVEKVVGSGSFGLVLLGECENTGDKIAIKRVLQDRRYKNRELQIMKMLSHPCIVRLLDSFYSTGSKRDEIYLNVVMEYVPETLYKVSKDYARRRQPFPLVLTRLFMFQLCRALGYMHALGACHRDIKPQNLMVDMATGALKLIDFGSAKVLQPDEPNVSYICSRYYRAPELIFGAVHYTTAIDVWSMGCVMAELFLGRPLFPGESGVDQLVEIIKALGAPTREQVTAMNKDYPSYNFPDIKRSPWSKIFAKGVLPPEDALDFLARVLVYTPAERATAIELLAHPWFAPLRDPALRLPNGAPVPPDTFRYNREELEAAARLGLADQLPVPDRPDESAMATADTQTSSAPASIA